MSITIFGILSLGPKLVAMFGEAVEPVGGRILLMWVIWRQILRFLY